MAPWGRRPGPYLIDAMLDPRKRRRHWLRHRFALVAQVTREYDPDHAADGDTLRWVVPMTDPDGQRRRIRILINRTTDEIFNAFPE
jgi:hypothetical protein